MRKLVVLGLIYCLILISSPVFAADEITIEKQKKTTISLKDKVNNDKKSLTVDNSETIKALITEQQRKDLEDLELIWNETVNKNQVIQFALKKLSVPEAQRKIHSSFAQKTLNAMISGVSYIPSILGTNYSIQTGAFAAARIAQNLINRNTIPQEIPMTDTEVIELAGMIENLQNDIIKTYYNYKATLSEIKTIRERLILYNKNYSNAIKRKNAVEIIIESSLYEETGLEEYIAVQNAKKYQLELQRLAGKSTIAKLNLYQAALEDTLLNDVFVEQPQNKDEVKQK